MQTLCPESAFRTTPNWPESEKSQWCQYFSTSRRRQIFWRCFVFLVKFVYWSKFDVNIITGSGIITILFYKGLTRNQKMENTPAWVLPNIWRPERVMDTKFGTNISNRILLNAAKFQGYSFYHFWVIKGKPTGGGEGRLVLSYEIRHTLSAK